MLNGPEPQLALPEQECATGEESRVVPVMLHAPRQQRPSDAARCGHRSERAWEPGPPPGPPPLSSRGACCCSLGRS